MGENPVSEFRSGWIDSWAWRTGWTMLLFNSVIGARMRLHVAALVCSCLCAFVDTGILG